MSGVLDIANLGGFGELLAGLGPVAWFVLLVLLFLSVVCWAIIFHKALGFRRVAHESTRFLKVYRESRRFSVVAGGAKRLRQSPLARLYSAAYQELTAGGVALPDLMEGGTENGDETLAGERLDAVQRAMRRVQTSEIVRLERYLPFLATTASAGPFIGLFGTVWGILTSFQEIGTQGSASLAVVAPGIAEALVATAAGLAAAIPAVIGYNFYVGKVRHWATEMENFGLELLNVLERRLGRPLRALKNGY